MLKRIAAAACVGAVAYLICWVLIIVLTSISSNITVTLGLFLKSTAVLIALVAAVWHFVTGYLPFP